MNLTDVTIDEGSANLKAGNFTLDHAVFKSDYEIKNIEGNNTVWSANLKYAHVRTANGLNNISFDPQPSGVVLTMTTVDGDKCNPGTSPIASRLRSIGTSLKSHRLNPAIAGSDTFLFHVRRPA